MKLFHISQSVNQQYDSYDSAVVAAPDEETAKNMHPDDGRVFPAVDDWRETWGAHDWCETPEQVKVRYIGKAAPGVEQGPICASFNAG